MGNFSLIFTRDSRYCYSAS